MVMFIGHGFIWQWLRNIFQSEQEKEKEKEKQKNKNIENFHRFFYFISCRECWIETNDTSKCSSQKVTLDYE